MIEESIDSLASAASVLLNRALPDCLDCKPSAVYAGATLSLAKGKQPDPGDVGDYARFRRSGALRAPTPAPTPYVHPFPPNLTQSTQESAEGRNPKMTKTQRFHPLRFGLRFAVRTARAPLILAK
jgi:hypothetical protein